MFAVNFQTREVINGTFDQLKDLDKRLWTLVEEKPKSTKWNPIKKHPHLCIKKRK